MAKDNISCVALYQPKNEINIGGAIRASYVYGVNLVIIQGLASVRYPSDPQKGYRHLPILAGVTDLFDHLPCSSVPVAVELTEGAKSLISFKHPKNATYIFGPEDGSVPRETLKRCVSVVKIPTRYCMNLAATVNVVLYDRLAKLGEITHG